MRILVLVHCFPVPSETFIISQVTALLDRGHDVQIMATERGSLSTASEAVKKYGLYSRCHFGISLRANRFLRLLQVLTHSLPHLLTDPRMRTLLLGARHHPAVLAAMVLAPRIAGLGKFDLCHAHFGGCGIMAALLKKIGIINCPVLVTFHGTDVNLIKPVANSEYYKALTGVVSCVSVGSEFMENQVRKFIDPRIPIVRLPMGVNCDAIPFAERHPPSDGGCNLILIGRQVEFKGVEYAIRMMAQLKTSHPRVVLHLVGDGPLRASLESLAASLAVTRIVVFHGAKKHEDVLRLISEAQIFIFPGIVAKDGTQEGQGVALLEAQASGLPVVASRVGGIPSSVLDGISAFLVPPKDVAALAMQVRNLVGNPLSWISMGRAGRRFVEQTFDSAVLADRLVALYSEILANPTPMS